MLRSAYKLRVLPRLNLSQRMVHQIASKEEFETEVASGVVVVDFWAEWCGPCKAIAPVYESLDKKFDTIKFLKVNFEEVGDLASQYDVTALPTFIVFKDGKPADVVKGANPQALQKLLDQYK